MENYCHRCGNRGLLDRLTFWCKACMDRWREQLDGSPGCHPL